MTTAAKTEHSAEPILGILGNNPLAKLLQTRASTAQLAVVTGPNLEALTKCHAIWITDPDEALSGTVATSIPVAVVVSGYQPMGINPSALPTLRLTNAIEPGSLAELLPPQDGPDALPPIIAQQVARMGYQSIILTAAEQSFVNRVMHSVMIEAMALLGEGVAPQKIEDTAANFAMAEPPLAMLDTLSLTVMDHALHAELHALEHHCDHDHGHSHGHDHDHHHDVSSQRFPESAVYVIEKMAHGFDRMGADSGYGFYDHEEDGSRELWDGLNVFARGAKPIPEADILDRLVYIQALETRRCVAEGLLTAAQADLASVAGLGFARSAAGSATWREAIDNDQFAHRTAELAATYGKRFQAAG